MDNKNQSIFSGTCVSAEQDTRRNIENSCVSTLLNCFLLFSFRFLPPLFPVLVTSLFSCNVLKKSKYLLDNVGGLFGVYLLLNANSSIDLSA